MVLVVHQFRAGTVDYRLVLQNRCQLVGVVGKDVVVDRVAGQLDLGQAELRGGVLRYVHDLAVTVDDEDEAFECLFWFVCRIITVRIDGV